MTRPARWDPGEQALLEGLVVPRAVFGRGWREVPMVNNHEPLDPYGPGPAADAVRAERERRGLAAVASGGAWGRRKGRVLAVLRLERFADPDGGAHRACWQAVAADCLEATWRARWSDRDVEPGWIEARSTDLGGDAVDWSEVEDHTGAGEVTMYQHLTIWKGRSLATLTVRHDLGLDLGDQAASAAAALGDLLPG